MTKKKVAVIGATGIAGQQFLASLINHPMFEVTTLAASLRSAGKIYKDAITSDNGSLQWFCQGDPPSPFLKLKVENVLDINPKELDLIFTAVESDAAKEIEPRLAQSTPVISTASAFRGDQDVPIFIPGVNMEHEQLIPVQKLKRQWKGFISPVPNCTTTGLAMALKPIQTAFGIKKVIMTSMQACSGAGRSPGVIALDIMDNIIPYIPKEEEKVHFETKKILGKFSDNVIQPADFLISTTCTRVPVLDAHTEVVYASLRTKGSIDQVKAVLRSFGSEFVQMGFPSCPSKLIEVLEDPFRPQPRRDRDNGEGMTTTIGRVREDEALENGIKFVLTSHNTKMGAARGAILIAEYLAYKGYI
jgi:aspartate-semialdehyde dehydrogenase